MGQHLSLLIIKLSWRRNPFPKDFLLLLFVLFSSDCWVPLHLCPHPSSPMFMADSENSIPCAVIEHGFHTSNPGGQKGLSRTQDLVSACKKQVCWRRQTYAHVHACHSRSQLHAQNSSVNEALLLMNSNKHKLHIHAGILSGLKGWVRFQ